MIVASVGPNWFSTFPASQAQPASRSACSRSPLHSTSRTSAGTPAAAGWAASSYRTDGTVLAITVTRAAATRPTTPAGSLAASGPASTSRAPDVSVPRISRADASKPNPAIARTTSDGPRS